MSKVKTIQYVNSFSESIAVAEETYRVYKPVAKTIKLKRIESIDLLRGVVMVIMALDHVRDYFHHDAFYYDPTDLSKTNAALFFTRFITHYCAPVFVFLSGISAYLYGSKKSKKELSFFLLTRGIWLVLAELFIVSIFRTFNTSFTYVNFQVIGAIGVCMMLLSAIIHMPKPFIFFTAASIILLHNMLDTVHVSGTGHEAFVWSLLHDVKHFSYGRFDIYVRYPVLPWLGVMTLGYYAGSMYSSSYDAAKRKKILLLTGIGAVTLFIILRFFSLYGDAASWSVQKNTLFSILSFINVTKYPPSLLYVLITLGPACIFLSLAERPLNKLTEKLVIVGRVPMFYYLAHILVIHILAISAAVQAGYPAMIVLTKSVDATAELQGYGFGLPVVYMVWIGLVLFLFPFCKWFDAYKRKHQATQWWLSYL